MSRVNLAGSNNEEHMSILVAGLSWDSMMKQLYKPSYGRARCLIKTLLCNTSSIQHIYNSNHDFDVSPFAQMPISPPPRVLTVIEGDAIDRQTAMFRLSKSSMREEKAGTKFIVD